MGVFKLRSYIINCFGTNPDVLTRIDFSKIKNQTIGVDILCILHNIMKEYDNMEMGITHFLNKLLMNNISALFVFDGIEKNKLKIPKNIQRRKENRLKDYRFDMINIVLKYRKMGINNDNCQLLKEELNEFIHLSKMSEEAKYPDKGCSDDILPSFKFNKKYIDLLKIFNCNIDYFDYIYHELEKETKYAKPEDIIIAIQIIQQFIEEHEAQFQIIRASGEADLLLKKLYKEGLFSICLTNDTDLLAHGVNKCLFFDNCDFDKMYFINRIGLINQIKINFKIDPKIRDMDNLFLNMCILSGTDYSPNFELIHLKGFNQNHIIQLLVFNSIHKLKSKKNELEFKYKNISQILDLYDEIRLIYI